MTALIAIVEDDLDQQTNYADALQQDPEFYSFLKSLQIYKDSLKEGTKVILTTDSSLFQYLENPRRGKP